MTAARDNSSSPPSLPPLEVERIGELLKALCLARSNLNLYSFEHEVARRSLAATHQKIAALLDVRARITIDITATALLFEGLPVEERNPMVERLARDLRGLRINGFSFHRGLTLKELAVFFKLLTLKKEDVDRFQGARALLEELKVVHISINQVRYVRLEDDKKIVSRDARVVEAAGGVDGQRELLNNLTRALLDKQADREWLLDEIRTDPARVADQMVAMIKYFDDRDVIEGPEKRQAALDALLGSIKTLGVRLAERTAGGEAEGRPLAQSLLILERELKARSAGLKSSKSVTRFVEEITSTVTAFIDNHQANLVVKEYLKDEKGLKRTEQLLRNILDRDNRSSLMPRLETVLREKGLSAGDLEKLLARITAAPPEAEKPRKKRKRRPRAPRPVVEKIEKALAEGFAGKTPPEELTAYLAGVFQREAAGRVKDSEAALARMEEDLGRVERLLGAAGLSLAALDPEGRVALATGRASAILGTETGEVLSPGLFEFIRSDPSGTDGPGRGNFLAGLPPAERERSLQVLEAIERPVRDEAGNLLGVILRG